MTHAADLAASTALHRCAASLLIAQLKNNGSLVTDADHEIERALRSQIRGDRPGDGFLVGNPAAKTRQAAAGSSTASTERPATWRASRSGAH